MNRRPLPIILLGVVLLLNSCRTQPQQPTAYVPDQALGPLFEAVQMQSVFRDSKTFADCTPRQAPEDILAQYQAEKSQPGFNLRNFVLAHFDVPPASDTLYKSSVAEGMEKHLVAQWNNLTRHPDSVRQYSSLLPLPKPYVVPGGRFREIYYWDSYFTMLGLASSDRFDLIQNMLDNFAYLIDKHGHIPNGNRTYYLSRSQPPFFAAMVKLYAQYKGNEALLTYLPQLEKEYSFWMQGSEALTTEKPADRRVVLVAPGVILNRYWDNRAAPRAESYREDALLGKALPEAKRELLYRNIRAACESGWDFSSRWFDDGQTLATINTTHIVPVDLNALLYNLESTLAEAYAAQGNQVKAEAYRSKAMARKNAVLRYCWNEEKGYFYDYQFQRQRQTSALTLAGMYPFYFGMADPVQAGRAANILAKQLLMGGGLVTTLRSTHQQWDSPNGWPPLQWMAIGGLRRYRQDSLASNIKKRWLRLNEVVFAQTGKMMEKYNVADLTLKAGGGEYPLQDGFGWTNGVALALIREKINLAPSQRK